MVAAFSAYINQTYGIKPYISSIVFVLIVYLIFNKNINGVIKINEILVPILVIFILYLGIKNIPFLTEKNVSNEICENTKGWLISAILYASYNSIILIPILTSLKDLTKDKKSIIVISVVCCLIIIILAFSIYGLLLRGSKEIFELEMPLIEITSEFGKLFKYVYGFVIATAIFTSVISTGYSFLKNVSTSKKDYNNISIIMCLTGIVVSNIGFSNLVKVLYPLFGVLGIMQIILLFM
jgi:uncharacterized membrane protein YkvI